MTTPRALLLCGLLLTSGCLYHTQENADHKLAEVAAHPFDVAPPPEPIDEKAPIRPDTKPEDVKPGALLPPANTDIQTTAFMQADPDNPKEKVKDILKRYEVPKEVPGADTAYIDLPKDPKERRAAIQKLYPPLPAVPEPPPALPGPDGCPLTLAALQNIAAANSPQLREAAANVEQARGNYLQAMAYPNPTIGYQFSPSSDGSTPSYQGPFIDQVIQTSGKLKLATAAAEMDLKNAELALKRARSDLSTQVRTAYFAVIVAKETVRVSKSLAAFTDEVYRIQAELLENGFSAPYEPAALRAQAYTTRLALKQAIDTYIYSWKQLVSTIGMRQLPLTDVAGRVDRMIPYYDYDKALAHVLHNHTDIHTAFNGVEKARYLLKAAQVTPIPNVEVNLALLKEYSVAPHQMSPTATISFPLPIWDHNKGNIMAAEAALMTATEEPHRVEVTLTNNFATAYLGYKSNLDQLEYYRKFILPDQVRYYRGVYSRRQIDINAAFGDFVQAQQTLAANVTTYLTTLGAVWTSVVNVADFLQTDDLFQVAQPHEVPELPDLDTLPPWLCHHPCPPLASADAVHVLPAPAVAPPEQLPPPKPADAPAALPALPAAKQ